jgi:hypothetical protein
LLAVQESPFSKPAQKPPLHTPEQHCEPDAQEELLGTQSHLLLALQ